MKKWLLVTLILVLAINYLPYKTWANQNTSQFAQETETLTNLTQEIPIEYKFNPQFTINI